MDRATTCPTSRPTKPPDYVPTRGRRAARTRSRGDDPFVMQADGKGWLFAPNGHASTGRCRRTTSRRSRRSRNPLYGQQANPARKLFPRPDNPYNPSAGEPGAEVFPYVFTTYRLTEHHTAGGMSRSLPYLVGAAAGVVLRGLARSWRAERGLEHGGWATIVTRPHRDRGAGPGHRADDARWRSAAASSTRSGCPTTGAAATASSRATRPTTCSASRSTRTCTSRSPRRLPATSARPSAARARPCSGWSRSTSRRAGDDRGDRQPVRTRRTMRADRLLAAPAGGSDRPDRRRRVGGRVRAADGLLHRHLDLHRLQGLRGGVQGVERRPRGRPRACSG